MERKITYNARTYSINIIKSENGGYVGYLKNRPNIISQGETINELCEMLKDALNMMIIYENNIKQ